MSSRAPFDTTRLDEECERIACELLHSFGGSSAKNVRSLLLGQWAPRRRDKSPWRTFAAMVFDLCRRPKAVPA